MPVLNLFPKMKLRNARRARMAAYDAYMAARDRKDSRAIHETWVRLKAATKAVLEAEAAR